MAITVALVMPFPSSVAGGGLGRIVSHTDKLIHFVMYLLLVAVVVQAYLDAARTRRFWVRLILLALVHGLITECIQLAVPSRYFDPMDLVAAGVGVVVGVVLCRAALSRARRSCPC